MSKQALLQLILILAVVGFVVRLFRYNGARSQALRRMGLVAFAVLAIISILVPALWNQVAHFLGVGRGVDIVLYALVIAFLTFTVTTYLRFRDLENAYTRLARRIALDEAERHQEAPPSAPGSLESESPQERD